MVEETNTCSDKKTDKERAERPLFPAFVHISLGVIAVIALLLWLWPASAIRGLSFRIPITLAAICFLTFYVGGEMIRWRFRISLWNMFAFITLLAVLCGGFGAWLLHAHQQRRRVQAIQQLGGYIRYETIHGLDGQFVTSDGWIVPKKLVDAFGVDVFARTREVGWTKGGISDAEVATLDLRGFSSVAICSREITDAGVEHVCQNPEMTQLWLGSTQVTDTGLHVLQQLPRLELVSLYDTRITDECLPHIHSLDSLKFIDLRKTQFTREGVEVLRQTLPGCQVLSDFEQPN